MDRSYRIREVDIATQKMFIAEKKGLYKKWTYVCPQKIFVSTIDEARTQIYNDYIHKVETVPCA